ncbi:hypothetical protein [Frankia sp. AgB32]|uniref:hypothetical protein n=1 Tax=Frankia sp. AgB32 TaxID=631119 RepID=UPI00200F4CB4|nr:hypothetical protein [Frankia sp. AgB32]MCK9898369.1 hypothetical protein [Frankia sp. AgB32]
MTKPGVCPQCRGRGKKGKDLCRACNPSGAVGDRVAGAGRRLADRLTGTSVQLTPGGVVEKSRGRVRVSRLPADLTPPGAPAINPQACDRCGRTGRVLNLTRKGAVCRGGC